MKLLTITETAKRLKMSPNQVRAFIKNDKSFPCLVFNKKNRRVNSSELDKWVIKQEEKSAVLRAGIKTTA